ncbi:hypothetical protein AB6A40_001543 [Gnathostoma spinigerum]|uniref:Uncharacterized protein n=1 Tax=Gnathostoma spinigerum TaxID=75299 RepID=A0ABD6E4F0_9BILA
MSGTSKLLILRSAVVRSYSLRQISSAQALFGEAASLPHVTKDEYCSRIMVDRTKNRELDSTNGIKPTSMQRHYLVLTRLYPNRASIPEIVPAGTMGRMHNRLRAVFIFAGVALFYTLFLCFEKAMAFKVLADKRILRDVNLTERAKNGGNQS